MKLIVGLGNPGKEYEKTRHNAGFLLIDQFADNFKIAIDKKKFSGLSAEKTISAKKIILLKPQTYMNLSGQSVAAAMKFYKVSLENILILYDDLDLALGKIRFREKGSSAGHNGVQSIIDSLGGKKDFARVKIGIDRPKNKETVTDYVLEKFSKEELNILKESFTKGLELINNWLEK